MHRPIYECIEERSGVLCDDGLIESFFILLQKVGFRSVRGLCIVYVLYAVLKELIPFVAEEKIIQFETFADTGIAVFSVDTEALPISFLSGAVPCTVFACGRIAHSNFRGSFLQGAFFHSHNPGHEIIQPVVRIHHTRFPLCKSVLLGTVVRRQGILRHISVCNHARDKRSRIHGPVGNIAVRIFSRFFVLDELIPTRIERHINPSIEIFVRFRHISEGIVLPVIIGIINRKGTSETIEIQKGFGRLKFPFRTQFRRKLFRGDNAVLDENIR